MNKKKLQKIQKQLKQIENFAGSLNASEHDLALFFFLSNDLLLISKNGCTVFCNKKLCEILGYSFEELDGKDWIELIHPEDHQSVYESRKTLNEGKPLMNYIIRCKHSSGNYIRICWNSIKVSNGTIYSCAKIEEK